MRSLPFFRDRGLAEGTPPAALAGASAEERQPEGAAAIEHLLTPKASAAGAVASPTPLATAPEVARQQAAPQVSRPLSAAPDPAVAAAVEALTAGVRNPPQASQTAASQAAASRSAPARAAISDVVGDDEFPEPLLFALVLLEREADRKTYGPTSQRALEELIRLLRERDLVTLRHIYRTLFGRVVEPRDDVQRAQELVEQHYAG